MNPPANGGDAASILGQEDHLKKVMTTPSGILSVENLTDRGAWQATVHGVTKSGYNLVTKQQQTFYSCRLSLTIFTDMTKYKEKAK